MVNCLIAFVRLICETLGDMFEKLIAVLYIKQGYSAYQTQFVGDQGVDVVAEKDHSIIAILLSFPVYHNDIMKVETR